MAYLGTSDMISIMRAPDLSSTLARTLSKTTRAETSTSVWSKLTPPAATCQPVINIQDEAAIRDEAANMFRTETLQSFLWHKETLETLPPIRD
jgi:hypothetical protein